MNCPTSQSHKVVKRGFDTLKDGTRLQQYSCQTCGKRFNERTGTPMSRLRTPSNVVSYALSARTEGMGVRATGRTFGKSHGTILRWEKRLASKIDDWSPPAPEGSDVTVEGDEIYTRVRENLPPSESEGWTVTFLERESRYWLTAQAGLKDEELFASSVKAAWHWLEACEGIRCFTDGERRYGKLLWKLASRYLLKSEYHPDYGHCKVWREGLEVAMKIKGSQGNRRIEWVKAEHPFTAISPKQEVHANHNEANNAALRRRCSAYRRRANLYAKKLLGLQRALDLQRLVHNWVRPHWGLAKGVTPAMAIGFCSRPFTMLELLQSRGFSSMSS